ncbi:MAG TPA: GldG family protein [Thermoanaerobaculia bacterium]|nr:GldG family protein [Thermoanaerobaculia bacterium]
MTPMAPVNRRQLVRTGTLSAGVLLVAALAVFVNYFGWKYNQRFDWTGSQLYSLSERTQNVLKELDKDVEFLVFLPPSQRDIYEPTQEVLARYDAASPRIRVRLVDPDRNPLEAQQLIQKYGVESAGIVVVSGNDRRVIDAGELAELDYSTVQFTGQPEMKGYKGEQLFTSALLQLSEGKKPRILFTTGHGELSLDDQGPGGLARAQQILGSDNFDIEEWASLGKPAVPEGTDLVVIAGPKASFVKPELDIFTAYLALGGRMLVMLDPTLGQAGGSGLVQTGLEGWLAGYGAPIGQNIVVDPTNPLPFVGPETIYVQSYADHPIVKPLADGNLPVLLNVARSVGAGSAPGLQVTELFRTSAEGWGESNLADLQSVQRDGADLAGPILLGVAVESEAAGEGKRPTRLVVFGDSEFAANQLLEMNVANSVLLTNALNWLVEREALLGIPPKKTEQVHLTLTSQEMGTIFLLAVVVLPVVAIAVGGGVFYRRRRR